MALNLVRIKVQLGLELNGYEGRPRIVAVVEYFDAHIHGISWTRYSGRHGMAGQCSAANQ
jgi:hypothetical protein